MPEIGVNKVILIGRAGADAEFRYTGNNGKAVANFSLAVNENHMGGTNSGWKTLASASTPSARRGPGREK